MEISSYGNIQLLNDSSYKLGIVGSRSIIQTTKDSLEILFMELRNFDFTIISGGMYGVDMYAHNLALNHDLKTIVILPQGINSYKKSALFSQLNLKENSNYLLLSKYPTNFSPRKYSFLERNKTISELSETLLVAQASLKSGSISTANYSFKINKKIICFPAGLDRPQFQGTNTLISRGASIYLNPTTILNSFNINYEDLEGAIKYNLQKSCFSLEQLGSITHTDINLLKKKLLELILKGDIFYSEGFYHL
jgi:DNA processing protein